MGVLDDGYDDLSGMDVIDDGYDEGVILDGGDAGAIIEEEP